MSNIDSLIPLNKRTPEERRAIQSKGGKTVTDKKRLALSFNSAMGNKNLSVEQRHFINLLSRNEFATAIRDMLLLITSKAKTAEEWHKVLNQLVKMPFIEKVYNDLYKEKQRDVIPIIVEVLREHGHEELIGVISQRLRDNGWGEPPKPDDDYVDGTIDDTSAEVPEVRPESEQSESQSRVVESQVDEATRPVDVLHVLESDSVDSEEAKEKD